MPPAAGPWRPRRARQGDALRQHVQHLARGVAAGHALRVGWEHREVAVPPLGELAALHLVDLGRELGVLGPVGGDELHPLLPGRGSARANPCREVLGDALGDQELRVLGPAVRLFRQADLVVAERLAIGVPGWPGLACWTASMDNVRMVLIDS